MGSRHDLDEAIVFAARGEVNADVETAPLGAINAIFADLKAGRIKGRMVLDLAAERSGSDAQSRRALAVRELIAAGFFGANAGRARCSRKAIGDADV